MEKDIRIKLSHGLHARPSSEIIDKLSKMNVDSVTMASEKACANALSILELLTSGFLNDTVVRVKATGKDAEAAVQVIEEVLSKEIY